MRLFKEFSPKVYVRSGNMLPLEEIEGKTGFATMYAFDEEAAKAIRAQGSSKGLGRFPVYADKMWWDLDDGDTHLKALTDKLSDMGLGYEVWSSGSKGYHLGLSHTPIFDVNVPYTHRMFAEYVGVPCDPTLYQTARLFRLPGTVHEKTGRPKELVEAVEGDSILEMTVRQPSETRFKISDVEDAELLPFFLDSLSSHFNRSPGHGKRHTMFWGWAKDAGRAGLSYETTLELLLTINASWATDSKDPEYVENACSQGWGN